MSPATRATYFAADVPADTTSEGFDQFRVWFHIGLSPWLDNERAFVGRAGEVSSLRAMRFPWGDHAPRSRTHWHIYERARGASSVSGHRRFELALDLDEAGIAPGVAFPLWLEVEGDPQRDAAGKFKARTDLGRAGSHQAPLWLRLAPRAERADAGGQCAGNRLLVLQFHDAHGVEHHLSKMCSLVPLLILRM